MIMANAASFLNLQEVSWFQHLLFPLLTHTDSKSLALVAVQCDLTALRHALLCDASSLQPISTRSLAEYAAKCGWWELLLLVQRDCRRSHRRFRTAAFRNAVAKHLDSVPNEDGLVRCCWIQRNHPLEFRSDTLYAAAERGKLEEVMWLHRFVDYDAAMAVQHAAKACHFPIVMWHLENQETANKRGPQSRTFLEIVVRHRDSTMEAICWYDSETTITYCVTTDFGFPPEHIPDMLYPKRLLYPFIDWAASQGNLALV